MSDMPATQTLEERALELFRTHFAVFDKPDLNLGIAIRYLTDRKFLFLPVLEAPSVSGRMFGGRIITPQLSWSGHGLTGREAEITFYLSVDALPIAALKPADPKKGQWTAIRRSQYGDEEAGVGVLYLE